MKRQIKFRFWNKHEKIMSIQSHVDPVFIKDETSAHALELKADAFEIMQFTGLKDKNGKEIYESDYLKQEGLEVEVKWSEFDAGFVFEDESGSQMSVTSGNSNQWEIIGNIYENEKIIKSRE